MKRRTTLFLITILVAILILQFSSALASDFGHAVIGSDTSSTVELRDFSSPDAKFLGSYYVGTEARLLEYDSNGEWAVVQIGACLGYMPTANLSLEGSAITPKWKKAVVNIGAGESLNVQEEPADGAAILGAVQRGAVVTIMGETERHWCYVRTDTLDGYLPADKLIAGSTALPPEPDEAYPAATPIPQWTNDPQQATAAPEPAQGDGGTAFVTAKTSKSVNLRASASTGSHSMGLYYVGTQVQCLSDPNLEWVHVRIGSESGYMKSEYLYRGTSPLVSRQPSAIVSNGSRAVSLRQEPSGGSAAERELHQGDAVTVLGETDTNWSYICTGSNYGYVMSKELEASEEGVPCETVFPSPAPSAPDNAQAANYTIYSYTPLPNVIIQYPVFADEKLNALILGKLSRMTEDIAENAAMMYSCAVTLNNDKMVSIVFWGSGETANGMHESTDLQTLNIDVKTYRELSLQDMYRVDDDFERVFLEKAYDPSAPRTSYNEGSFAEMLMLQTPAYKPVSSFDIGVVQCFLKPDGIVLSMPAVHATGSDHFEGQLNYGDIQSFYLLQDAYW